MKKIFTLLAICMFVGANAQEDSVESKLIKNGFYVETFVGTATTDYTDGTTGGGLKLGNVWYFGESDFWRPGFKTVWFRGAAYFGDNDVIVQGSVMNVGFANIIEFKPNLGLEVNINVGYNVVYVDNERSYDYYNGSYNQTMYSGDEFTGGGVMINPELKFRYDVLAIGLDFVFSKVNEYSDNYYDGGYYNTNDPYYYNNLNNIERKTGLTAINLSIGAKF